VVTFRDRLVATVRAARRPGMPDPLARRADVIGLLERFERLEDGR
jgi:hypothetical protein